MGESSQGAAGVHGNGESVSGPDRWSQLVLSIAGGDSRALSEFYDEASRYVHTIALRILRDPDEAEEITLDVFQQVWKLASSYDPARCAVPAWVAMMARSRALDRWRSLQTRRRRMTGEMPEGFEPVSSDAGPESTVAARQDQVRVRTALEALPAEQRRMIQLSFWGGLSHSEVAEQTGVPLGTVKTRIRLGMLKLREALDHGQHA